MANWRMEPPTEKQKQAIVNMQVSLGTKVDIPPTKGECSDKIKQLKETIQNHIQVMGKIKVSQFDIDDDSMEHLNDIF